MVEGIMYVSFNKINHNGWILQKNTNTFKYRVTEKIIQEDTKKREILKNPQNIEEIHQKNFINRNWTITTCLLRDSNPDYQCLKITSCRWLPTVHGCHYAFQNFPFFCVTLYIGVRHRNTLYFIWGKKIFRKCADAMKVEHINLRTSFYTVPRIMHWLINAVKTLVSLP